MSKHQHTKKRHYTIHYLLILSHRWVGISIALFVLLLAITGIMLNHTEELELSKQKVNNSMLLSWYGIKMPKQQHYYKIENNYFVQLGQRLYFNQNVILNNLNTENERLIGVIESNEMYLLATTNTIFLLTKEGELIEKLEINNGLPSPITHLSIDGDKQALIFVKNSWYQSIDDYLSWQKVDKVSRTTIIESTEPTTMILKQYQDLYLGNTFPLERLILDLHSGRILNKVGVALMDLAAVLMIFLTLTGGYIWVKRTFRGL